MAKVGSFLKQTLKNGAKVIGGHRVKFVSEDKEFIILLTSYGYYYGLFLTYESDGAHIDEERTPKQSKEHCFNSLDECKKFWKVGEYAEANEESKSEDSPEKVRMQTVFGIKEEKPTEKTNEAKVLKAYKNGTFYEFFGKDADKAARVLSLTVAGTGDMRSIGIPDVVYKSNFAKLVKAGYDVKVIVNDSKVSEKPKANETSPKKSEKPQVEVKKLDIANPAESKGMEAMREQFVKMCDEQKIDIDKTCIKQSKEDPSHGTLVGYKDKAAVVEVTWYRKEEGKEKKYFIA